MTDRRPQHSGDHLTDDRLDALVRRAALAGPLEALGTPTGGLPILTRLLLALGLLGVAGAAIGFAVVLTRPAQPTHTPTPTPAIADAAPAPAPPEADSDTDTEPAPEAGAEPARPARSFVVARFTPEQSQALAAALFPESEPEHRTAPAPAPPTSAPTPAPTPDPARQDHLLALGRALRSAMTANDTLDLMHPDQQVEACRVWASDPSLRPVAFERLQHLASDPALAGPVRHTAEALARDTAMRPWLMSYGFQETARASAEKPSTRRTTKGGA